MDNYKSDRYLSLANDSYYSSLKSDDRTGRADKNAYTGLLGSDQSAEAAGEYLTPAPTPSTQKQLNQVPFRINRTLPKPPNDQEYSKITTVSNSVLTVSI